MNTETASTVVVADRFPTQLLDDDGRVVQGGAEAKVFLTQPDADGIGGFLAYSAPDVIVYDTTWDRNASRSVGVGGMDWVLATPEGNVVVRPGQGCACGSRLKGWIPQVLQPFRLGRLR